MKFFVALIFSLFSLNVFAQNGSCEQVAAISIQETGPTTHSIGHDEFSSIIEVFVRHEPDCMVVFDFEFQATEEELTFDLETNGSQHGFSVNESIDQTFVGQVRIIPSDSPAVQVNIIIGGGSDSILVNVMSMSYRIRYVEILE